jgi:hypothetical protein
LSRSYRGLFTIVIEGYRPIFTHPSSNNTVRTTASTLIATNNLVPNLTQSFYKEST